MIIMRQLFRLKHGRICGIMETERKETIDFGFSIDEPGYISSIPQLRRQNET